MNLYFRNSASARSHRRLHFSRLPPLPAYRHSEDETPGLQIDWVVQERVRLLTSAAHAGRQGQTRCAEAGDLTWHKFASRCVVNVIPGEVDPLCRPQQMHQKRKAAWISTGCLAWHMPPVAPFEGKPVSRTACMCSLRARASAALAPHQGGQTRCP